MVKRRTLKLLNASTYTVDSFTIYGSRVAAPDAVNVTNGFTKMQRIRTEMTTIRKEEECVCRTTSVTRGRNVLPCFVVAFARRGMYVGVSWVGGNAGIGFPAQAKLARFESAEVSALHALPFGSNLIDTAETQRIGV